MSAGLINSLRLSIDQQNLATIDQRTAGEIGGIASSAVAG